MELFETNKYYIIVNGSVALFCDRLSGQISLEKSIELPYEWNPVCLGKIRGVIGKINLFQDGETKLILINKVKPIGTLPIIGPVYRITKISVIPINIHPISNLDIDLCSQHHFGIENTDKITSPEKSKKIFKIFQQRVKNAAESVKPKRKDVRDKEKFEKRMLEEFDKMFEDGYESSDCFYISYSPTSSCDITSNIRKQNKASYSLSTPLWRRADDNFFWNKSMLQEAIDSADKLLIQIFGKSIFDNVSGLSEPNVAIANTMIRDLETMLMPIIQGFVQVEPYSLQVPSLSPVNVNLPNLPQNNTNYEYSLHVALISRRNRYRAGTRFRRRGVDTNGKVANYVETEQILRVENNQNPHVVSFVQIRGSVPVFWSQFSLKYRPPIVLEKSEEENQTAFKKHFETEFELYGRVIVVNLVDTGTENSERKIADAYLQHLIKMNSPSVTCVMFDFHDYCHGLQFDNVSILIKGVTEIFRDMKYTWVDKNGMICEQKSIFRVNCVDCLDRTNVVQCMLAGVVIETQLRKLGLLSPEESLPNNFHRIMLFMWANNGDAISRQYSGTAAMKGDFTRTGARTVNGLMKDGVSSVNRYYLRLKEMSRQAALDIMTGNINSAEIINLRNSRADTEQKILKQKEENLRELVAQCKKLCLKNDDECLAESILIYCDENEKEFRDVNTIALITLNSLYFIKIKTRQPMIIELPLQKLRKIEIGYAPTFFRSNHPMLRLHYEPIRAPNVTNRSPTRSPLRDKLRPHRTVVVSDDIPQTDGFFLSFRQPSLRLFNNLLLDAKTHSDMVESLTAVAKSFYSAAVTSNPNVLFEESMMKFEKLKCEALPSEWLIPANLNMAYENIALSSSFNTWIDDDDELIIINESINDCLEENEHTLVDQNSTSNERDGVGTIDFIKNKITKVKDKVKLSEWKYRLATFSVRNRASTNSLHKTLSQSHDNVYNSPISLRSDLVNDSHETNCIDCIDRSPIKECGTIIFSESKKLFLSSSDDEIPRKRDCPFVDFSIRRVKSDLTLTHRCTSLNMTGNCTSSIGGDHNSAKESTLQGDIKSINTVASMDSELSHPTRWSSLSNLKKLYKDSVVEKNFEVSEIILESCGIINFTSKAVSLKDSSCSICGFGAPLAAATGGAYKRRAERISLQLSTDESQPEFQFHEYSDEFPVLIWKEKFKQTLKESRERSLSEISADEFMDICPGNIESAQNLLGYITMPPVDIRSPKVVERLSNKQIQLAYFVDDLRKRFHDNEPFLSKMIIF